MRLLLAALLFALTFTVAHAADRREKIRTLMQAQGLAQMFDEQLVSSRAMAQEQAQKTMRQMIAGLKPPPATSERLQEAAREYITTLSEAPTGQQMVDLWAEIYGKQFTEGELDRLIAFYASPLGKKEVQAGRSALPEFVRQLQAHAQPLQERAMQKYIDDLKRIMNECHCTT